MAPWLLHENAISVAKAENQLPRAPGKYAFHIRAIEDLPPAFRNEVSDRPLPTLLYIGKADVSLYERVWLQECQHRSPGTFFRSIGAMLGYRSPEGGRNYEFAPSDKLEIIAWIAENLTVAWTCESVAGSHRATEKPLIQDLAPLLNLQGNPRKLAKLERLRAKCRAGST